MQEDMKDRRKTEARRVEEKDAAAYVLISNIYAESMLMKDNMNKGTRTNDSCENRIGGPMLAEQCAQCWCQIQDIPKSICACNNLQPRA